MSRSTADRPTDPRIVVTGIGAVTPVGQGVDNVWQRLLEGTSGIAEVHSFDTRDYNVHLGGEVDDFDPTPYFRTLDPGTVGRASQLAVVAARMAVEDAGLELDRHRSERVGVAMGTTSGEPREVEHFNDSRQAGDLDQSGSALARRYPCHVIATQVATELGAAGVNTMIPAACAAGNYAMGFALDTLRAGRADVMLAGGADAFSRITYTGFARLGAIAPERCQPFDRSRRGMIPGEGAAVLVLEPLDAARRRGARIYAELAGYGLSCDAHHMTAAHPEGAGAARAIARALEAAGLDSSAVSYVSAHGTGTPTNDRLETRALERIFGRRAHSIPTSSVKSMIGHTMGAASAIEGLVCAMAVSTGRVPPTINFEEPDPECAVDCVPNTARELEVEVAMSNAYAFGGNNASVIFRNPRGVA